MVSHNSIKCKTFLTSVIEINLRQIFSLGNQVLVLRVELVVDDNQLETEDLFSEPPVLDRFDYLGDYSLARTSSVGECTDFVLIDSGCSLTLTANSSS